MAYRPLRQRRINRLEKYGFTHSEAINLTWLKTVYPSGEVRHSSIILNRPYVKLMMRERYKKYRQAIKERVSKAEWRRRVNKEYEDNGWLTPKGTPDYWAMFRFYYKKSIQLGDYKPPPQKRTYDPDKPHKKRTGEGLIDREHIKRQRAKYKAKTLTQPRVVSGDTKQWIEQLKTSMREAKTTQQREQFRKQIENLGGTP